jgi:hypothetical protein
MQISRQRPPLSSVEVFWYSEPLEKKKNMFGQVLELQGIMKMAQRKSLKQQRALGFFFMNSFILPIMTKKDLEIF